MRRPVVIAALAVLAAASGVVAVAPDLGGEPKAVAATAEPVTPVFSLRRVAPAITRTIGAERLRADIIKYSKYERGYDYFRRYGDTMIVAGTETVVPTPDANRPDAGKTVRRRFTELWVRRDGGWEKVARHASNVMQP